MGDGIGIESRLNLPERFRYERVVRKAKDYRAGDRRVIADLSGPGCVRHFYCVGSRGGSGGDLFNRNRGFIIRFYWDGEEQPSVEVPLADLFGCSTATARPPAAARCGHEAAACAVHYVLHFGRPIK